MNSTIKTKHKSPMRGALVNVMGHGMNIGRSYGCSIQDMISMTPIFFFNTDYTLWERLLWLQVKLIFRPEQFIPPDYRSSEVLVLSLSTNYAKTTLDTQ